MRPGRPGCWSVGNWGAVLGDEVQAPGTSAAKFGERTRRGGGARAARRARRELRELTEASGGLGLGAKAGLGARLQGLLCPAGGELRSRWKIPGKVEAPALASAPAQGPDGERRGLGDQNGPPRGRGGTQHVGVAPTRHAPGTRERVQQGLTKATDTTAFCLVLPPSGREAGGSGSRRRGGRSRPAPRDPRSVHALASGRGYRVPGRPALSRDTGPSVSVPLRRVGVCLGTGPGVFLLPLGAFCLDSSK